MKNDASIERMYDVLDESAMLYYNKKKLPYLKGVVKACENITAGSAEESDPALSEQLNRLMDTIEGIEFSRESVRKALQLCILKGFKHIGHSNEGLTPDSIGIFMAYLVDKLFLGDERLIVFDPLVGTANLLTTFANHSTKNKLALCGVEDDENVYPVARAMFDMMGYGDQVYFQETLTFSNIKADVILTDFPLEPDNEHLVYDVLDHHSANIRGNGFFLGVVDNDFFGEASSESFKEAVFANWQFIGLIHLPNSMFKKHNKSILILRKKQKDTKENPRVLMADIPSFDDKTGLEATIKKINQWFKEYFEKEGD